MAKLLSGWVFQDEDGNWFARLNPTDEFGRRKNIKRRAENKTAAKELLKKLIRDWEEKGERGLEGSKMTFRQLADWYEKQYVVEPQYVGERKVKGLRSKDSVLAHLDTLRAFFKTRKIAKLTHADLEKYRAERLATRTYRGTARSVASVNRELEVLRRMLNVAVREGWIVRSPFNMGDSLISKADEHKRERIITRREELQLLAACTGKRNHLRPIIICALDTGMRKGEIFKLTWADVDFDNRIITVQAFNTKTMRQRQVAMTERLTRELQTLFQQSTKEPDTLCFGVIDNVKRSFDSVRKAAGIEGLRFHDLRHTAATRLAAHLPLAQVGRVLGHTQANTTYRYINSDTETVQRAAAILDSFHAEFPETEITSKTIN